jgi:predicted transposase/invertase (TIGR01784 family)
MSEIQIRSAKFFDERALYYSFERYVKNYGKAGHMEIRPGGRPNRYSSLRPVFALNILGYPHFQDEDALRIFELYDPKRNKSYNKELLRLGFFELSKPNIETVNQRHWHTYFTTGEAGSDAPDYIKKASQVIDFENLGKEEREVALAIEKAQAIYDAELVSSYLEGEEKGEENKALEIAKAMLKNGLSPEMAAECTGLPLDVIQKL